ncbi:MAG: transposase, partial [Synergistaceae bacterium]|nr:transposase [Synergistaceae bacterium]
DDLRERIDDIIWRVNFRGRTLYLCIIIEFQSAEDRWMAARLMTYTGLLYDDIVRRKKTVDGKLPPVLPIVLHTGLTSWKSPCSVKDLIAPVSPALSRYSPSLDFLLLDAAAFEENELEGSDDLASFLFRMERSRAPEELIKQISRLGAVLEKEKSAHLRRSFTVFLTKALLPRKTGKKEFPDLDDLLEVEKMITDTRPEWADALIKEGEAKGEKRGILLGEKRGLRLGVTQAKRDTALRMLRRGMSAAEVAELVDLPQDEVLRLAKEAAN